MNEAAIDSPLLRWGNKLWNGVISVVAVECGGVEPVGSLAPPFRPFDLCIPAPEPEAWPGEKDQTLPLLPHSRVPFPSALSFHRG